MANKRDVIMEHNQKMLEWLDDAARECLEKKQKARNKRGKSGKRV